MGMSVAILSVCACGVRPRDVAHCDGCAHIETRRLPPFLLDAAWHGQALGWRGPAGRRPRGGHIVLGFNHP